MIKLLDVCKIGGKAVKDFEGEKKYIATGDIIDNQIVSFEKVTYKNKPSRANVLIDINDVIFAKMQNTIKVLKANEDNIANIYSTGFYSLTPGQDLSKDFLYYFLNSKSFNSQKDKNCSGATQKALNNEGLEKILIKDLPSMEEQLKIVKKISLLDELVNYKKNEINKLEELIKSQFVEMFGNININNKGFEESKLSKCLKVVGGYAFKSKDFKEKGIPVLRIGNINTGYFRPKDLMFWSEESGLENYAIYPGDVVMSLTGTVGKDDYGNICIVGDDFKKYYLNQRNAKLILNDNLNSNYIAYALRIPEIKKRLTGISRGIRQANISNKDIENLIIPIPPIELQNKFAMFVELIDKQKFEFEKQLEKLEELQASLMQEYFG